MTFLVWLHLVGSATWLGGLVTLGAGVLIAARSLPRPSFREFVRQLGWAFASVSLVAWLLIGVSGLLMAFRLHWPRLLEIKTALAGAVLVAAALHVLTSRWGARLALIISRVLALLVLAGSLAIFWLGAQLIS